MLQSEFWNGRRVLLTGHTGFKGSWLSIWLQQVGAEVWGYALQPEPGRSLFSELGLGQGQLHHRLKRPQLLIDLHHQDYLTHHRHRQQRSMRLN